MRLCLILLLAGCPQRLQVKETTPVETSGPPACEVHTRRLSPEARASTRPAVAAAGDLYGVVWEDSDGEHRGIRFQALDRNASPLAPSVEVADLKVGGADPRVITDGDGFMVSWTVEEGPTSVIELRRVDARGKPRSDVIPAVSAPSARALALSRYADGYALVWWSWAESPPLQAVTFLDGECRPRGKNVELSRCPLVEPVADLLVSDRKLEVAWEEQHDGVEHVFAGALTPGGLSGRVDLGPGDSPSLTQKGAVFAHLDDASIWWSPLQKAQPARFTDGLYPDARPLGPPSEGRGVLCVVRLAETEEGSYDELDCMTLHHGEPVRDDKIASAARGLRAQDVAVGADGFAVAYQTQEADADAVHLATAKCP
jgi:hypothetical protein